MNDTSTPVIAVSGDCGSDPSLQILLGVTEKDKGEYLAARILCCYLVLNGQLLYFEGFTFLPKERIGYRVEETAHSIGAYLARKRMVEMHQICNGKEFVAFFQRITDCTPLDGPYVEKFRLALQEGMRVERVESTLRHHRLVRTRVPVFA